MEDKVYPVLYYDLKNTDLETLNHVHEQLEQFFARQDVPFLLLPKDTSLKWLTKKEALQEIKNIEEYVETWE